MTAVPSQSKSQNLKLICVVAGVVATVALAGCLREQSMTGVPPVQSSTSITGEAGRLPPTDAAFKQLGSIFTNSIGAEMVRIAPGEFMIGSTPAERARARAMGATELQVGNEGEQPRRSRICNGFWIGRTELTVGQWQQFVNDSRYQSDAIRGLVVLDSYPERKPEDHPISWVT